MDTERARSPACLRLWLWDCGGTTPPCFGRRVAQSKARTCPRTFKSAAVATAPLLASSMFFNAAFPNETSNGQQRTSDAKLRKHQARGVFLRLRAFASVCATENTPSNTV